ncbi:hypothetical protein SNEBB_003215 [Seison nebaliae]|nr:hypothetical protein SNEBB_003215 [Seison nebaliae]
MTLFDDISIQLRKENIFYSNIRTSIDYVPKKNFPIIKTFYDNLLTNLTRNIECALIDDMCIKLIDESFPFEFRPLGTSQSSEWMNDGSKWDFFHLHDLNKPFGHLIIPIRASMNIALIHLGINVRIDKGSYLQIHNKSKKKRWNYSTAYRICPQLEENESSN